MGKLFDEFSGYVRTRLNVSVALVGYDGPGTIPEDMTFLQWLADLQARGMKIDGKPFSLDNRQALLPLYEAIPTTREEAAGKILVVQKATQLGLTVWEVLANVYMAIKFGPVNIGMFMPDQPTASFKSEHRFMRILRSVPELLHKLTHRDEDGKDRRVGEGNVLTRVLGESILMFLWTTGKVTTESRPMDIVSLDEVQEMALDQIDKVMARLGDSDIGFVMLLSTANMPALDINFWYQQGDQAVWHTECPHCKTLSDLSDPAGIFPDKSIAYNNGQIPGAPEGDYVWTCPSCGGWIEDPQIGRTVVTRPGASPNIHSFLLPRTISPKITPRKMIEGYHRAKTGNQKKSFYNRTLARPYIDADQLPVTMAHCLAAVEAGRAAGVVWKTRGRGTYMGIDQMGSFNAVIIKERLPDGRQAVIHVEAVFDHDPFARCDELMEAFGVALCVVEQLPNVNDARRFANRHMGRVFLAGYADLRDDMMRWGDDYTTSDRKTSEEDRSRYTVTLNQYKCMQTALYRVRDAFCLFPDPDALEQDVLDDGKKRRIPLLRDWVFTHFTKTALIVTNEGDEDGGGRGAKKPGGMQVARKTTAKVAKVGIDPHYAYANMLCDVAWARNHGTGSFMIPQATTEDKAMQAMKRLPGLPPDLAYKITEAQAAQASGDTCGNCSAFDEASSTCQERQGLRVKAADQGCPVWVRRSD